MRALLHSIFIGFYLLSSYATTQSRIDYIGTELQHSNSHSQDVSIGHGCKDEIPYTRFREAKKTGIEFDFRPAIGFTLAPRVTVRGFSLPEFEVRSQADIEVSHSRAPPALI